MALAIASRGYAGKRATLSWLTAPVNCKRTRWCARPTWRKLTLRTFSPSQSTGTAFRPSLFDCAPSQPIRLTLKRSGVPIHPTLQLQPVVIAQNR